MSLRITRRGALAGVLAGTAATLGARRAWSQAGSIKIGVTQTLSGPVGLVGQSHLLGARIAAKMTNDAGGIDGRQVELVVRDVRINPSDMVAAMRELSGAGVNLIFGDAFTATNLAAVPVAPSLNVVYVCTSVIGMELTHELYNRNIFRAGPNAITGYRAQTKTIFDRHPGIKRFGSFLADSAGFRTAQTYIYAGLRKYYGTGLDLKDPVVAKLGANDYRVQCNDLVGQDLSGLIIADTGGEMITFIKQARAMGLFRNLEAVGDMTYSTALGPALRRDIPNNHYSLCTWAYDAYKQFPMAQTFYKLAAEESKLTFLDPFFSQAHTSVMTLIEGVRRAKTTETDAVIKQIETMTYDTVYGPLSFRPEDHQIRMDPAFVRLGPDDGPEGWKIKEFIRIPWQDVIEPATPGVKFELS